VRRRSQYWVEHGLCPVAQETAPQGSPSIHRMTRDDELDAVVRLRIG
jgi:hypothetical protein